MAEQEPKKIIEREYVVPLRREWLKVPKYRRAKKAVRALKEFIAKHMKIYDRDLRKVKVDVYLNNEIRFMGMKKPLGKIKVKAIKYDNGIVEVKLITLPKHIEFEMARKVKKLAESMKQSKEAKKEEPKKSDKEGESTKEIRETKEQTPEDKIENKEKEASNKEATQLREKQQAKQFEHTSKTGVETPKIQRKVMKR